MENETPEFEIDEISEEDFEIIVKIIEKALTFREYVKDAIIGAKFRSLANEEMVDESLTNRIDKWYFGKLPCLFIRFVGTQTCVIEAFFYPIEAVNSFLVEARTFQRKARSLNQTDEDIEKLAFEIAVDMFLIMLDNFWQRGVLMMNSFTDETIAQWHHTNYKRYIRNNIAVGNKITPIKYNAVNESIDKYSKELKKHWEQHGQNDEAWKKIRLSEEYEPIHTHWKMIRTIYKGNGNWRGYAKTEGFEDLPDDLLDKLENTVPSKLCNLAMEHAARRVGLLKQNAVKESVLAKRREGIFVTDYTYQNLKDYENEGKSLAANLEQIREYEQNRDFLKVKNRKLVEQNLEYFKADENNQLEHISIFVKDEEENGD